MTDTETLRMEHEMDEEDEDYDDDQGTQFPNVNFFGTNLCIKIERYWNHVPRIALGSPRQFPVATCVAAAEIKTGADVHVVYPPMGSQLRITNIVLGAADKGAKSSADERVLLNCSANGLKYDTMIPHRTTC